MGTDCKSVGGSPSMVQIHPSPPVRGVKMAKNTKNFVSLECTECKSRNYVVKKSRGQKEKLELKKYCPKCRKHTVHKEVK